MALPMARSDSVIACDKGTAVVPLVASGNAAVSLCGTLAAVVSDALTGENISPFGMCAILTAACVPLPNGKWVNPIASSCIIGDEESLLEGATLPCTIGGTISVMSAAQASVFVGQNMAELLASGSPAAAYQYLRELFEALGNEKVLDRLSRATPDEVSILSTILSLPGGREHAKDVLSGAAIWIQDGGDLAGRWSRLGSFYRRTSSHKRGWFDVPLSTTGAVNGPLSRTILFGTVGAPGHHAYTWVQLEGSPGLKNPVRAHSLPGPTIPVLIFNPRTQYDNARHTADYIRYEFTDRNQGPYGSSGYTDKNPLILFPRELTGRGDKP